MKAMVCEMCNSHDLLKQDGMYVCQSCGTKYTVEEAKKLLVEGTVKIDKTDDVEKLLVLARRAREDNNSENAEKYYGLVLQEDPNNWEAAFFHVYFQSAQCKIRDIESTAHLFANNIDSSMRLVSEVQDVDAKNAALNTIILHSNSLASVLYTSALNHFTQFPTVAGSGSEFRSRASAIYSIYSIIEQSLSTYFGNEKSLILNAQKKAYSYICDKPKCFNESFFTRECNRLKNEIKSKDPNCEVKEESKGGCYVATAVYGSYDCPQVWTLRRYRDNTLAKTWYGLLFIYFYYAVSPTLVKWFGETKWFKNMWKPKLDRMVKHLNDKGVEDTPYNDKRW